MSQESTLYQATYDYVKSNLGIVHMEDVQNIVIEAAIQAALDYGRNESKASALLDINRNTCRKYIKKFDIQKPSQLINILTKEEINDESCTHD